MARDPEHFYWEDATEHASEEVWAREQKRADGEDDRDTESLISAETALDNTAVTNFRVYSRDYPEKIFSLIEKLRPEFQELFIEYYILDKPQNFLAQTHGEIQTRVWQQLRIIEQTICAMIVLPDFPRGVSDILSAAGLEQTEFGDLSYAIRLYHDTRNYVDVAKILHVPVPAIRKVFRPMIAKMLESDDLAVTAVGAHLRNLTYQVSLSDSGLSKSSASRLRRVRKLKFDAPARETSPLFEHGNTESLNDLPWNMLELSSDAQLPRVMDVIRRDVRRYFGKQPVQVFAPTSADGTLALGYLLVRSAHQKGIVRLMKIRGISDVAALFGDDDRIVKMIEVPAADIAPRIAGLNAKESEPRVGSFVRIITGEAKNYCGTVVSQGHVQVCLPTGRTFEVSINPGSTEVLNIPKEKRAFWGEKISVCGD